MNYYIPFSLNDGEHNIFDVITSIIGAEGIAPSGAAAFNGVETPRSSPAKFTGYHPLNPFANRVLAFSKLPILSREGKYASVRENTVYLCVNGESIEIPGIGHLELNEHQPLAGVELHFTSQAVLFKDPSSVTFIFMSENVFVVKFAVESEAYQAFAELKAAALTNDYAISQAFLVKNEGGKLEKTGFAVILYRICPYGFR